MFCSLSFPSLPSSATPGVQARWFQPSARADVSVGSAFNGIEQVAGAQRGGKTRVLFSFQEEFTRAVRNSRHDVNAYGAAKGA